MISISTRLRPFKTWQSVPLLRPWTPTTTSTSRPSPTQPSSTHRFQLSIRRMSVWFAYLFIHLSILSLSFITNLVQYLIFSFGISTWSPYLFIYLYFYQICFPSYISSNVNNCDAFGNLAKRLMTVQKQNKNISVFNLSLLLDKPYVPVTVCHG